MFIALVYTVLCFCLHDINRGQGSNSTKKQSLFKIKTTCDYLSMGTWETLTQFLTICLYVSQYVVKVIQEKPKEGFFFLF